MIWTPQGETYDGKVGRPEAMPAKHRPSDDTIQVTLHYPPGKVTDECPDGIVKKQVNIRKQASERWVYYSTPDSRLVWTKAGTVTRLCFVPSNFDPLIWVVKEGSEVPNAETETVVKESA